MQIFEALEIVKQVSTFSKHLCAKVPVLFLAISINRLLIHNITLHNASSTLNFAISWLGFAKSTHVVGDKLMASLLGCVQ